MSQSSKQYLIPLLLAHEYTHALQNESLGGTWYVLWKNCQGHETGKVSSYKCALKEGLADYGGRVGKGNAAYWEGKHWNPPNGRGAGEIEGNVAALFHDLIDSNNTGNDNTTYPARFVLMVFKTCRVPTDQRDDTADFVWCMENRVDSDVHEDHFPGLSAPSGVRHTASSLEPGDYDADDVRDTWRRNVG